MSSDDMFLASIAPGSGVDMKTILRRAMDAQRVTDPHLRAGIAAIAGGESGFSMKPEQGYAHTANSRIREIFGGRVPASDAALDALKASDEKFFNTVYGGSWGARNLGNTAEGDGYKFRGRGLFQLTGRSNYTHYGTVINHNLTDNPDAADTPEIAAAIAVAYMKSRYKGGGWTGMMRAVGNNIPDIANTKTQLYERYLASNEFGPMPGQTVPAGKPA